MKKTLHLSLLMLAICFTGCTPKTTERAAEREAGNAAEVIGLDIQTDKADSADASSKTETSGEDLGSNSTNQPDEKQQYKILAWNVELDGGADPNVIARQMKDFEDYGIIALMETTPEAFEVVKKSIKHKGALSKSGRRIRLAILWDDAKFSIENFKELDDLNEDMKYRSPWTMLVKDLATGRSFHLVTVHLARGWEGMRQRQARGIRDWAREKSLPVVAIGDFNFDYVFADEKGNEAFNQFLEDGIMKWVRPEELIDTNWYDPEKDGVDNYPGSMLDFAFVAGPAKDWSPTCRVIVRDGDFPDDKKTSDHRPIELLLTPNR